MVSRTRAIFWVFLLSGALLPAADEIPLANGSRIVGSLLRFSDNACTVADSHGQVTVYHGMPADKLTLDTTTTRYVRVLGRQDDPIRVLRVEAFEKGTLHCRNGTGEACEVQLGTNVTVEFYQAEAPSRRLRVPHVRQKPDYCGEACIEMATRYRGEPVSQDRVNEVAGLRGARGVYGSELVNVIDERLKLETAGRTGRRCLRAEEHLWDRVCLVRALSQGRPVLLGVWCSPENKQNEAVWTFDHFVLLVGYDLEKGVFLINDPAYAERDHWEVTFERFPAHRTNRSGGLFHIEFPPWRTWTIAGQKVRAEFVSNEKDQVRLLTQDGSDRAIPLKDLSDEDREAVQRFR